MWWSESSPEQFETSRSIPAAPGEAVWPKRLRRGAWRDDLRFAQIDRETNAAEDLDKGRKEEAHGGRGARAKSIVKIEGATVEAQREGVLSGLPSLLDDGVDGQSKEGQALKGRPVAPPGAGNNLITGSAGAREKMATVAITAVHPWSEREGK